MHKIILGYVLLFFLTFYTFTVSPALAAVTYTYDTNGNMTSDGTNCYTYDENNDLIQVRNCSNGQLKGEYVYDDQGNRIIQKIYENGVLSQTIYTPTKSFEATKDASSGAISNTAYYMVNGQIAARKNADGSKTYYNNDNLGSSNILTNQAGQLVEKTTYYPFGGIQSGGTQSKFLYTGQKRDSETGLDYYNARYYNDQIRRFTQPDEIVPNPYNPQSLNRYSYVNNNPLTYNDPTGHVEEFGDFGINYANRSPVPYGFILGQYLQGNKDYLNSPEYTALEKQEIGIRRAVIDAEINVLSFSPISIFGIDAIGAFNSGANDVLDKHKMGTLLAGSEYKMMALNAGKTYVQGKINGFLSKLAIPDSKGSPVNKIITSISQAAVAKTLEVVENNRDNIFYRSSNPSSQGPLVNAGVPTYNFADTLKSHGFDLNYFKTLKL